MKEAEKDILDALCQRAAEAVDQWNRYIGTQPATAIDEVECGRLYEGMCRLSEARLKAETLLA